MLLVLAGIVKSISKYLLDQVAPLGRLNVTLDAQLPFDSELVCEPPEDVPTFRLTFVGVILFEEGFCVETTTFVIKALINPLNNNDKKRTFHLVINSFENRNNSTLKIKENESTLLYFNNSFDTIQIQYELNKNEKYPILISFFIKERVKFQINCSNGENGENTRFRRTIDYIDKIQILNEFFPKNSRYIYISITKVKK